MKGMKTGGRQAGTPNKATEETRELVQKFVAKNWTKIQKDYDSMEPAERLKFITSLLRFVLPPPLHEYENLSDEDLNKIISELKNMGYDTLSKD
jgi:predicted AAA+ superfamily ATPase